MNTSMNTTEETFEYAMENQLISNIFLLLIYIGNISGQTLDSVLMYIIYKEKPFRTRTYMILLHWSINDYIILTRISIELMDINLHAILAQFDGCLAVNAVVFMLLLISTTFGKSEKYSLNYVLIPLYALELITVLISFAMPIKYYYYYDNLNGAIVCALFTLLLVNVLIKEVLRFCKRNKAGAFSEPTNFRMNVVGIFALSTFMGLTLPLLYSLKWDDRFLLDASVALVVFTSTFVSIYLIKADKAYKESFVDLFRRILNIVRCKKADNTVTVNHL